MDRNEGVIATKEYSPWSLSARRAWIEIRLVLLTQLTFQVALRKESVDRNPIDVLAVSAIPGRSPQGERG